MTELVPSDLLDGRYRVIETLGHGTFGRTMLAEDVEGKRQVAIKSLRPEQADGLKAYELFDREARVLGELRHQGIPAIYDSFRAQWDGAESAFLVMEYISGKTLDQMITDAHAFDGEEVVSLVLDLTSILQYLHERLPPILHRDIKPGNIILRDGGTPVLVDFGAVRDVFHTPDESGSTVVGTYGYMPYEQYMGQATPSSDLYALGATLLHLLTRRPPSDFLSDAGRIEVPDNLPGGDRTREVLVKLLQPAPPDRYPSAEALRTALLRPASSLPLAPAPGSVVQALHGRERAEAILSDLPPGARDLTGRSLELFTATSLKAKTQYDPRFFLFLSMVSLGVVPLVHWFNGLGERNRLRPFFIGGKPVIGILQSIHSERNTMGENISRVTYEFEAEGVMHRGADRVFPRVADRWRVDDAIPLLYLPDQNYDSIIVIKP